MTERRQSNRHQLGAQEPTAGPREPRRASNRQRLPVRATAEETATASLPATVQFATADDLAARLGLTFSPEDQARANLLLQRASGLIQAATRQTIALVEDDEYTIMGPRGRVIPLPELPVVSVASVVLNGTEINDWYLDGSHVVLRPAGGVLFVENMIDFDMPFLGGGFGWRGIPLVITYTHGWDNPPEPIGTICLEAVRRVWVNPGSLISETQGSSTWDYMPRSSTDTTMGLELTTAELEQLRRVFGRPVRSIPLR